MNGYSGSLFPNKTLPFLLCPHPLVEWPGKALGLVAARLEMGSVPLEHAFHQEFPICRQILEWRAGQRRCHDPCSYGSQEVLSGKKGGEFCHLYVLD